MSNIIKLSLLRWQSNPSPSLFQYDYGQRIMFTNGNLPETYEVHFANERDGESITMLGDSTGVDIPDEFLLSGKPLYVWLFLHTGESDGETKYDFIINVRGRAKPTNTEPTPVQQDIITQTIARLNEAVTECESNVNHYPCIIDDIWYVWDVESNDFISTGVRATGEKGDPGHIFIRYSENMPTKDSDMKITPDAWMGIYSGPSETAPTSYTSYEWNLVRGGGGSSVVITDDNNGNVMFQTDESLVISDDNNGNVYFQYS